MERPPTLPFASDGNRLDGTLCPWESRVPLRPLLPISPSTSTDHSCSGEVWASDLPVPCPCINLEVCPYFHRLRNECMMPITSCSGKGTSHSRAHGQLDTRMWSPHQSFIPEYTAPFGSQIPLMDKTYDASTLPFLAGQPDMQPIPHTLMRTQSDTTRTLISEFSGTQGHYHTDLETEPEHGHYGSLTSSILASTSLTSTEDVTSSINDRKKKRPPVFIYHPAEKRGPGHPRSRRACAINIDGIWIDKEELSSAAEQGNDLIVVHECLWAKDGNPCDMWIVGSRSGVGAHVRKWHGYTHTEGRATLACMWDGCEKKMTQGSINRHVVTAHLEERFHCQGCEQTFSRKDVYKQHVEKEEVCKGLGAKMVYGTERRVIDVHEALQQEGALRYSG
ncbi:hypothetical protein JVU11DRAFT_8555 [Chiua virens]|nr:hypothetical protein JVU11DRAFT_8555 [Chiua virens]